MTTDFSFIIPRHAVLRGHDGLSPLQEALLTHLARIRIAAAPTGAGKSYAFQRAVEQGQRVLFIVPTQRLAQNLARSLIEAQTDQGVDAETAASRVAIWTSAERQKQAQQSPDLHIGRLRIRQLRGLEARKPGDIIIATPESAAYLLLRPPSGEVGDAPAGIHDPIREFDHVVFDEFHSIEARGFGLAAAIAKVAATIGEGGARVTFLSATPVDIIPPLVAFGVPREAIAELSEAVVTGGEEQTGSARALHGDVTVAFRECADMADLALAHEAEIRACFARGRQVVMVFDALRDLLPAKRRLAEFFDALGVPAARRLAINSADDGVRGGEQDGLFTSGKDADPMQFDVLIATSSVEMGVTFRAGLMLMDPGHDCLSFVQRVGRVARGDEPGNVIVRVTEAMCDRRDWLRRLMRTLAEKREADGRIVIEEFTAAALRSTVERFRAGGEPLAGAEVPSTFRSMPMRAVWCAGLFWVALENSWRVTTGMRRTLESFRPDQAKTIGSLLATLRHSSLHSAKRWAEHFEAEALRLRFIPPRVWVEEPSGRKRPVPWHIYASYAELLAAPTVLDEEDNLTVLVERSLEEILGRGDRVWLAPKTDVLFPDGGAVEQVDGRDPARDWVKRAQERLRRPLLTKQRAALEAAIPLVRLSRIVPVPGTHIDTAPGTNVIV